MIGSHQHFYMFPIKWCKGFAIHKIQNISFFFSYFEGRWRSGCGSLHCSTALHPLHSACSSCSLTINNSLLHIVNALHSTRPTAGTRPRRASTHSQPPRFVIRRCTDLQLKITTNRFITFALAIYVYIAWKSYDYLSTTTTSYKKLNKIIKKTFNDYLKSQCHVGN